jgi:hypothetical protein
VRWLALALGAALVTVAFLAGSRVADTREGLVYEVTALLAGLAGVILVLYGWVSAAARTRPASPPQPPPATLSSPVQTRFATDLLIGGGGLVIAAFLVLGIALSAGLPWALMGLVLLLPMVIGCTYLCLRFLRAPQRVWRIDLPVFTRRGQ